MLAQELHEPVALDVLVDDLREHGPSACEREVLSEGARTHLIRQDDVVQLGRQLLCKLGEGAVLTCAHVRASVELVLGTR